MKKTLLSLSLITVAFLGKAQTPCSDLIISEYVEGKGNNKAIELYNTSSSVINLADYRIIRWDNGGTVFVAIEGELALPSVTIAPYQAYVIALDLTDPAGTGQTAPIDAALEAAADILLCPGCATGTGNSRVMCFNGDDALELQKTTNGGSSWSSVDIFACIGERPLNSTGGTGAGWTSLAPYSSMPVGYDAVAQGAYFKQYWTLDKDLRRKSTVQSGVIINPAPQSFNASVQWDSLAYNNYTNLGTHDCSCNQTVGLNKINKLITFAVYPNPASSYIKLQSNVIITKIIVNNIVGQEVKTIISSKNLTGTEINVSDLPKGVYTIIVFDDKNNRSINKFIVD